MKVSVLAVMTMTMALAGAACGGDSATAPSTATSSGSAENFTGSLAVQGSSFYSFTVAAPMPFTVRLASERHRRRLNIRCSPWPGGSGRDGLRRQ